MSEKSYYEQRLGVIGVTPENNIVKCDMYKGTHGVGKPVETKEYEIFTKDEFDNVIINYYNLLGAPYVYRKDGNKGWQVFNRTRLKVPRIHKDGTVQKYTQAKGSGLAPFFPPSIIEKFNKKETIPFLVFTEGEFKAFKGALAGLDIVGLIGYHGFYDNEFKKRLHYDIENLIITCKVEKILLLTDADTLTINYEPNKNLYNRPNNFYSAVKIFREATDNLINRTDIPLKDVFFGHILDKFNPDSKGLDDLLFNQPDKAQEIIEDLKQTTYANKYFNILNVSDNNLTAVRKYFGISSVEEFYRVYGKIIGTKEFLYRNGYFHFDGEQVIYQKHKETGEFMRVGDQWYRNLSIPNKHLELEERIVKWKIGEIERDYKEYPNFVKDIKKYKSFCNVPDNSEKYSREHYDCFNMYSPLDFVPAEGDITHTINFLKHLFGGEGYIAASQDIKDRSWKFTECANFGDTFTVALDYLTIMYRHPQQILFVPCLVSPENNTGKSTFLKWLGDIYKSNATILGNEEFKMPFNSHYIQKFIIAIDEGFIEVEKKADKERIKKLATDEKQFLQFKGVDMQPIDYFGKIIICSNDADNLMRIEDGEIRWFLIRVPQLTRRDPFLRDRMRTEIPAFLHFLKYRDIYHPNEDRAWIDSKYLITDQLKKVIATTKTRLEKEVNEYITNMFLTYRHLIIRISLEYLADSLSKAGKYKVDKTEIKKFLKDKKGMEPEKPQRIQTPIGYIDDVNGTPEITYFKQLARPYVFLVDDWLNLKEMEEFKSPFNPGQYEIKFEETEEEKLIREEQADIQF
jgi:hypothetical protein